LRHNFSECVTSDVRSPPAVAILSLRCVYSFHPGSNSIWFCRVRLKSLPPLSAGFCHLITPSSAERLCRNGVPFAMLDCLQCVHSAHFQGPLGFNRMQNPTDAHAISNRRSRDRPGGFSHIGTPAKGPMTCRLMVKAALSGSFAHPSPVIRGGYVSAPGRWIFICVASPKRGRKSYRA